MNDNINSDGKVPAQKTDKEVIKSNLIEVNPDTGEKVKAVMNIQRWLRALTRFGYDIPMIMLDGKFGKETERAVKAFQKIIGVPETGVVDETTWNALYDHYCYVIKQTERGNCIWPFNERLNGGCVDIGDTCNIVYIIQVILETLSLVYRGFDKVKITGIYDQNTMEAIKIFQQKHGFAPTGCVDKQTWNALANAYNIYINRE